MATPKIAVQMMMLKGKVEELGVFETLKTLSEMGYSAVEVSQIDMSAENVQALEKAVAELNMDICALSTNTAQLMPGITIETLADNFDKIVADAKRLNVKFLRIGMIPFNYLGKPEAFVEFARELNSYGKRLNELGLKLFYHNHHVEFAKTDDGKYYMDLLIENSDPDYVGFELDVHWLHRAGQDPVEWIQKLEGRVELVHLKDYRIAIPEVKSFADIDKFMNCVEFAEIGEGNLDFKRIIAACERSAVQYMPIEQDMTYGRDPFESLQISMDNLKKLGYASYF